MRILIADDDRVTLRFLAGACRSLGCDCVTADDGHAAIAAAAPDFDLLLLDVNMPGSGGVELLAALRALGVTARAIATSAELDRTAAVRLLTGGFADVLEKPVSIDRLSQALRAERAASDAGSSTAAAPLLDDASALTAIGGDVDSLRALRSLLRIELEDLVDDLAGAMPDLGERLHRLVSSCGFCGAAALGAASKRLHALTRSGEIDPAERAAFGDVCRATLAALARGSGERAIA